MYTLILLIALAMIAYGGIRCINAIYRKNPWPYLHALWIPAAGLWFVLGTTLCVWLLP